MKLLSIYKTPYPQVENSQTLIGFYWSLGIDGPYSTIPKPDRGYYQYFHGEFIFLGRAICIDLRLNRMPYRNYDQYVSWNKERFRKRNAINN